MKKVKNILLVLAMIIAFSVPVSAATNSPYASGEIVYVAQPSGVKLYTNADAGSTVLATIPYWSPLQIASRNGVWLSTTYGGRTGWVYGTGRNFSRSQKAEGVYEGRLAAATKGNVTVYDTPSDKGKPVGAIARGTAVDAIGYTADWKYVRISYNYGANEIVGYVKKSEITLMYGSISGTGQAVPTSQSSSGTTTTTTPATQTIKVKTYEKFHKLSGYVATASDLVVNLYAKPAKSAAVKEIMYRSAFMRILKESNTWYKVQFVKGLTAKTGYVLKRQVIVTDVLKAVKASTKSVTLKKNQKEHIKLTGITRVGVSIKWKSADKRIAKVSRTGKIKGLKKGKTTVTATLTMGNRSRKIKIKVRVK